MSGSALDRAVENPSPPEGLPFGEAEIRARQPAPRPDTAYEQVLSESGFVRIAGVDEAGRGPLAGPVVAAAVILPFPCPIEGIDDSKRLSPARRALLYEKIHRHALACAAGICTVETIDAINILQAARRAMRQAVLGLSLSPDFVLVDAITIPEIPCPQRGIIHGDRLSLSIAAASIIAKVTRDRMLEELDREYPQYGFAVHKGYATREHLAAITRHGVCPAHRRSFAPVREALGQARLWDDAG